MKELNQHNISVSAPSSPKFSKRDKYFVIKKANPIQNSTQQKHHRSMNIFKNSSVDGLYKFDHENQNPVGGMQTFLNYKLNRKRKNKTFKTNIDDGFKKSFKETKEKTIVFQDTEKTCQRKKQNFHDQVFKKHQSYSFQLSKEKSKSKPLVTEANAGKYKKQTEWVEGQRDKYLNKMAYLNEIYFKKPLNEIYGDQYFQYCLRNRYEDQMPPPPFIYQIKQNTFEEVENNSFIKKIRNMYPGLKNRKKIVLKGSKVIR